MSALASAPLGVERGLGRRVYGAVLTLGLMAFAMGLNLLAMWGALIGVGVLIGARSSEAVMMAGVTSFRLLPFSLVAIPAIVLACRFVGASAGRLAVYGAIADGGYLVTVVLGDLHTTATHYEFSIALRTLLTDLAPAALFGAGVGAFVGLAVWPLAALSLAVIRGRLPRSGSAAGARKPRLQRQRSRSRRNFGLSAGPRRF